ncbi:MAG: protein kinase [Gemmatimonadota bacterium]|nr:MAG: protein kinase [Gemmatimonadota bacterium]
MASSCLRCAASLPFDGAPCPSCGTLAPAPEFYLGPAERPSIHEELLEHLRAVTSGEFEILREIGHGGMARVYLAHEVALDRQVALKVLSPLFTEYPEIVKRFQHEARTAGQLNHPHIVPVFAVYQGDGLSFFTMPFVRGASFREILRESGPFDLDEALEYLGQAASGLAYAHQHGVVHRDVKPENMMLEETTGRLVLTDFGLAKALGAESLTVPGDMIGTPHYMAPEQLEDVPEVDGRCDQYSLALVAYEMLAGAYPFDVNGFRELLMKQLYEHPAPLLERRPDLPEHVCQAIHRGLAKSPDERFEAIEEFAGAMLGGVPIERTNGIRSKSSQKRGVFDTKTVWMRDRLLRFHKRRRLIRWTGRAAVTAAASVVAYLAVAAVSRGGLFSQGLSPERLAQPEVESVENGALTGSQFVEIDLEAQRESPLGSIGPPAPAHVTEDGDESQVTPARASDTQTRPASAGSSRVTNPTPAAQRPRQEPVSRPAGEGARRDTQPAGEPEVVSGDEGEAPGDPASVSGRQGADDSGRSDPEAAEGTGSEGANEEATDRAAEAALVTPEMVLERYRLALETEDLEDLARLYGGEVPAEDLAMLTRIFESADQLQVEMEQKGTRFNGDRRIVEVDFAMRYVLARTRRSNSFTLKLRMTLEEGPGGWQLVELDRR